MREFDSMRMLLRYGFVLLLTLTVLPLRALDAPPPRNLIPELNFQNPAGWSLGSEGTIQSVGGKFADQVLEIRRSNGSLYQPVSYQLNRKQLRNNTVYTFGAWVQGTQDSNPSLAIEFHDEAGKYLSGVYLGDHNPSMTEWHLFSGEFTTPENAGHAKLTLFCRRTEWESIGSAECSSHRRNGPPNCGSTGRVRAAHSSPMRKKQR